MAAGSERAARCSVATAHSASETLLRRGLTSPWKAQEPPRPSRPWRPAHHFRGSAFALSFLQCPWRCVDVAIQEGGHPGPATLEAVTGLCSRP